jgi:transcriptional regulator with XRE-family HTH domain
MNKRSTALIIRAKILGVLIRNARLVAGKNLDECAQIINISSTELEDCELGNKSLSLPELEILAHYLEVPLDHFWGRELRSGRRLLASDLDVGRLVKIRTKIIGTLLRMAREEAGLSLETMADQIDTSPERMKSYELGDKTIPLPLLETITSILGQPISIYQDKGGPLGERSNLRKKIQDFNELPPELQAFVSQPINRPYIELAKRLSEMSVNKLRTIAEGLLEITL